MSDEWPAWAQTEDNWNGYGEKATLPAVVESVERLRPVWETLGLTVFPNNDGTALVENDFAMFDWNEAGECPPLERIAIWLGYWDEAVSTYRGETMSPSEAMTALKEYIDNGDGEIVHAWSVIDTRIEELEARDAAWNEAVTFALRMTNVAPGARANYQAVCRLLEDTIDLRATPTESDTP